jgi:hypothetical protein
MMIVKKQNDLLKNMRRRNSQEEKGKGLEIRTAILGALN